MGVRMVTKTGADTALSLSLSQLWSAKAHVSALLIMNADRQQQQPAVPAVCLGSAATCMTDASRHGCFGMAPERVEVLECFVLWTTAHTVL